MNILSLKKVVKSKRVMNFLTSNNMIITITNWKLYFHCKPFRHLKRLENENVFKK